MGVRRNIRTIKTVLNKETGKEIIADGFFNKKEGEIFSYRRKLQEAIKGIRSPLFVCYICGQKIKINGGIGTNKILHFSHFKDSDDCPLKIDSKINKKDLLRAKYNGAKESPLHKKTKNLIRDFLLLDKEVHGNVSFVATEKVKKSKVDYLNWKKPDVTSVYKDLDVVFEIQLSTTFLSVIVDREHFYKENNTYIIWIFKNFELEKFKQRFTDKDIFYSNNRNAFVLDSKAISLSKEREELILLCHWQKPEITNGVIELTWCEAYVSLADLTFDSNNYKVYYFDYQKEEEKVNNELNKISLAEKREDLKSDNIKYINRTYSGDHNKERRSHILQEEDEYEKINIDFFNRLYSNHLDLTKFQGVFRSTKLEIEINLYRYFNVFSRLNSNDKRFLQNEFRNELKNTKSTGSDSIIYYLAQATFYAKYIEGQNGVSFSDYNLGCIVKYEKYLFTILSLKFNRVIGFNYVKLSQIANLYFNEKSKYFNYQAIIVFGIQNYYKGGLDEFYRKEDKKGGLRKKIENYLENSWQEGVNYMKKEKELSMLISIIFPKIDYFLYL